MVHKQPDNFLSSLSGVNEAWELFHENSKASRYQGGLTDEQAQALMEELLESLTFQGYAMVDLPRALTPLNLSLEDAMAMRSSTRTMTPSPVSLRDAATILHYSYGATRKEKSFPRSLRPVPSAGALYPLELFLYSANVAGLEAGFYHYNPVAHNLRLLRAVEELERISAATVHKNLVLDASIVLFITALFERSTSKYGDRGYRFVLLEAGHLTQNINLVSTGLGLGSVNIGGFFDRQIDELLELDGLRHSTIYMVSIGKNSAET